MNAGLIFSTRPGALSCRAYQQPSPRTARSPGSARPSAGRCGPGLREPFADRACYDLQVLDPDHIKAALDAGADLLRPVLTPVTVPGPQPSIACFTRPRRFDPHLGGPAGAAPAAAWSAPARSGRGSAAAPPVDRAAATATPRSMPTTWPLPGAGTGAGITADRRHAAAAHTRSAASTPAATRRAPRLPRRHCLLHDQDDRPAGYRTRPPRERRRRSCASCSDSSSPAARAGAQDHPCRRAAAQPPSRPRSQPSSPRLGDEPERPDSEIIGR